MKKAILLHSLLATFACTLALADDQKTEVTKTEPTTGTANAFAHAEAKAAISSTTTNVNGRAVTITEEPDENGKMHRKMITYSPSGKPRVKDITPKDKAAEAKPGLAAKAKPADASK